MFISANAFYYFIIFVLIVFLFGYWAGYEQAKINAAKKKEKSDATRLL